MIASWILFFPLCVSIQVASTGTLTDEEIVKFVEKLYEQAILPQAENIAVKITEPMLFTRVDAILEHKYFKAMSLLLQAEKSHWSLDKISFSLVSEFFQEMMNNPFMDAVIETSIANNHPTCTESDQCRMMIKRLWFARKEPKWMDRTVNNFRKGMMIGNCQFSDTFLGKANDKPPIVGNWIAMMLRFINKRINVRIQTDLNQKFRLVRFLYQHPKNKENTLQRTLFVGTDPRFDLAVYTLCYLMKINSDCFISEGLIPVKVVVSNQMNIAGEISLNVIIAEKGERIDSASKKLVLQREKYKSMDVSQLRLSGEDSNYSFLKRPASLVLEGESIEAVNLRKGLQRQSLSASIMSLLKHPSTSASTESIIRRPTSTRSAKRPVSMYMEESPSYEQ